MALEEVTPYLEPLQGAQPALNAEGQATAHQWVAAQSARSEQSAALVGNFHTASFRLLADR